MCKCAECLPWIYWVILWCFWDNQAHMNSHHGKGWCCLDNCFLRGQRNPVWSVGVKASAKKQRESCPLFCSCHGSASVTHWTPAAHRGDPQPVPGCSTGVWPHFPRLEPAQAGLCQAGLWEAELCSTAWGLCLVLPVLLVPLGSRSRAALHWYKTALLP